MIGEPLAIYVSDASLTQCQVLADHGAQLRFVLRKFLEGHRLRDSQTSVSSIGSFRIAITAVTDLLPAYLRGCRDVDTNDSSCPIYAGLPRSRSMSGRYAIDSTLCNVV